MHFQVAVCASAKGILWLLLRFLVNRHLQVAMKARGGAALVAEQENLMAEYAKIVAKAQRTAADLGQLSPLEHWREAAKEAEELLAGRGHHVAANQLRTRFDRCQGFAKNRSGRQ
jgi:hypothetical protein